MSDRNIYDAAFAGRDFAPIAKPQPTTARPGSTERVRIYCERLAAGQELFHPDDESVAWERADFSCRATDREIDTTSVDWRSDELSGPSL